MRKLANIPKGWTIAEAIEESVPLTLRDEFNAARQRATPRRIVLHPGYEEGELGAHANPEGALHRQAQQRLKRARYAVEEHLRGQLRNGTLSSNGRRGSPLADPQPVPASAWSVLRFVDWTNSIAKEGSVSIFDVRIAQHASIRRGLTTVKDATACRAWLEKHILANPDEPIATKERWWSVAESYWKGLSRKQFGYAWQQVTEKAPAWRRPGNPIARISDQVPSPP